MYYDVHEDLDGLCIVFNHAHYVCMMKTCSDPDGVTTPPSHLSAQQHTLAFLAQE